VSATGVPVRVPKTAELVARRLRRDIILGEVQEGDALPSESALMEEFGVSRPTLREAFRVLESEGLIEVHRGARGGARVRVPTEDVVARYAGLVLEYRQTTIVDVATARALLEPPCAAAIAHRRDRKAIAELRSLVEDAEALEDDPGAQLDAQHNFHARLVELAGNQTIAVLHGAVQRILDITDTQRASVAGHVADEARHEGARAHRRLVELLEAGDAAAAEALWRRHIDLTTAYHVRTGGETKVLDLL
jgi:DNA-binding FadR family transcriptional regulator